MLSAYINAPDMEGAEKFFRRIKQDGLEPNVVTYGTLIKGYAKINGLEKMMEKYEQMRVHGIKANQTIFTTIMDANGRNKEFGSAVAWFNEMVSSGVSPDQKAKNILLSLAKTSEEQMEAKQLTGCVNDLIVDRIPSYINNNDEDDYGGDGSSGDDEDDYDDDDGSGDNEDYDDDNNAKISILSGANLDQLKVSGRASQT